MATSACGGRVSLHLRITISLGLQRFVLLYSLLCMLWAIVGILKLTKVVLHGAFLPV